MRWHDLAWSDVQFAQSRPPANPVKLDRARLMAVHLPTAGHAGAVYRRHLVIPAVLAVGGLVESVAALFWAWQVMR